MQVRDFLHLTSSSLIAHRLRSFLTALGIAVGVAAVVSFVQGNAEVEAGNRSRRTTIYGAGSQMPEAF